MDKLTGLGDSSWISSELFKLNSTPETSSSAGSSLDEKDLNELRLMNQVSNSNVKEGFQPVLDGSTKPKRLMTRLGLDASARLGRQIISKINGHQSIEILQVTHLCQNKSDYFRWGWISALQPGDRFEGASIVVEGWLVGKAVQPTTLRFKTDQTTIAEIPINIPRPDVLKVHFYDSIFCNCGYKASLNLQEIVGTAALTLDAIFPNGQAVPAGIIQFHKYN